MGDKNPKSQNKHASQKTAKAAAENKLKQDALAAKKAAVKK